MKARANAGRPRPGKGAAWLRATLQEVAWAAVRTKKSYYRALYHRLKGRSGPKKANVAVQHAMLVALWHMLTRRVSGTRTSAPTTTTATTPRASGATISVDLNNSAKVTASSSHPRPETQTKFHRKFESPSKTVCPAPPGSASTGASTCTTTW